MAIIGGLVIVVIAVMILAMVFCLETCVLRLMTAEMPRGINQYRCDFCRVCTASGKSTFHFI